MVPRKYKWHIFSVLFLQLSGIQYPTAVALVLDVPGMEKLVHAHGRTAEILGDQRDGDRVRAGKNGVEVFRLGLHDADPILLTAQFAQEQLVLLVDLPVPDTLQFRRPCMDGQVVVPRLLDTQDILAAFLPDLRPLEQADLLGHTQRQQMNVLHLGHCRAVCGTADNFVRRRVVDPLGEAVLAHPGEPLAVGGIALKRPMQINTRYLWPTVPVLNDGNHLIHIHHLQKSKRRPDE